MEATFNQPPLHDRAGLVEAAVAIGIVLRHTSGKRVHILTGMH